MTPIYEWPSDDAPGTAWGPPSGTLNSPRATALFTGQQLPSRQKPAPKTDRRRKKVDKAKVAKMYADGYQIRDIATVLGVLPRTVVRALKEYDDAG